MADNKPSQDQSGDVLTHDDDFQKVYLMLQGTAIHWEKLGICLGMKTWVDKINGDHAASGNDKCLRELISEWLKGRVVYEPTWKKLYGSVMQVKGIDQTVALDIERKYLKPVDTQTMEAALTAAPLQYEDPTLSLENLTKELQPVGNLYELGLKLLVSRHEIEEISVGYPINKQRRELIEKYLRTGMASWTGVISALRQIGHHSLADHLQGKYVAHGGLQSSQQSTLGNDCVCCIEMEALMEIKRKFGFLVGKTLTSLRNKDNILEELHVVLATVYVGSLPSIFEAAQSLKDLFISIAREGLWDCFNYELLRDIIEECTDVKDVLRTELKQYEQVIVGYQLATRLTTYITKVQPEVTAPLADNELLPEPHPTQELFKTLRVKFDLDVQDHALEFVERLWKAIASKFGIPKLALILEKVLANCIWVVWRIPAELAPLIEEKAQEHAVWLKEKLSVLTITLDEDIVYTDEDLQEKQTVQSGKEMQTKILKRSLSAGDVQELQTVQSGKEMQTENPKRSLSAGAATEIMGCCCSTPAVTEAAGPPLRRPRSRVSSPLPEWFPLVPSAPSPSLGSQDPENSETVLLKEELKKRESLIVELQDKLKDRESQIVKLQGQVMERRETLRRAENQLKHQDDDKATLLETGLCGSIAMTQLDVVPLPLPLREGPEDEATEDQESLIKKIKKRIEDQESKIRELQKINEEQESQIGELQKIYEDQEIEIQDQVAEKQRGINEEAGLRRLELKDLVTPLYVVTDWFHLGLHLGVPFPTLVNIHRYKPHFYRKTYMLKEWINQMGSQASWAGIVVALVNMRMRSLAKQLAEEHGVTMPLLDGLDPETQETTQSSKNYGSVNAQMLTTVQHNGRLAKLDQQLEENRMALELENETKQQAHDKTVLAKDNEESRQRKVAYWQEQKETLEKQFKVQQSEVSVLQERLLLQTEDNTELKVEVTIKRRKMKELRVSLNSAKEKHEILVKEASSSRGQLRQAKGELEASCKRMRELETDRHKLQVKVSTMRREVDHALIEMAETYMSSRSTPDLAHVTEYKGLELPSDNPQPELLTKAPQLLCRGSTAVDVGRQVAYFSNYLNAYAYNWTKKSWYKLPDYPLQLHSLGIVGGLLTAMGNMPECYSNTVLCLVGEDKRMRWESVFPPMPSKRSYTAVVCMDRYAVVMGGMASTGDVATVEVLDTDNKVWSTASSLPFPQSRATATNVGGYIYLLGGFVGDKATKKVLTCSLTALVQSCQARSPKPTLWHEFQDSPVFLSTCVSINGKLVLVGGCNSVGNPTNAIYVHNTLKKTWDVISHVPTARKQCLAAVLPGNKLMVVGGNTSVSQSSLGICATVEIASITVE